MLRESLIFAGKDLKIELRTKHMFNMMIIFALLIILAFKFAFITTDVDTQIVAPAILWITFSFAAMYGLTASFAKEKDKESLSGLLLCPAERSAIYLGKVISNLIMIFLIEIASIIFFVVFFSFSFSGEMPLLILIIILGTFGFVIVGTLISAISINTRSREVLLPIMLIPLVIFTIIMPSITATTDVLTGGGLSSVFEELRLLGTFDIVYFIIGMILFEYVIEE
jgi:heme exporter protein B